MEASYTKLRDGSWGVRCPAERANPGSFVVVVTRAGARRSEKISRVIWRGTAPDGREIALCAIQQQKRPIQPAAAPSVAQQQAAPTRRNASSCQCPEECCQYRCRCENHCACRGGNVFDC